MKYIQNYFRKIDNILIQKKENLDVIRLIFNVLIIRFFIKKLLRNYI